MQMTPCCTLPSVVLVVSLCFEGQRVKVFFLILNVGLPLLLLLFLLLFVQVVQRRLGDDDT